MTMLLICAIKSGAESSYSRGAGKSSIRHRHTMVAAVLTLPDQPAAITRPCSTATRRMPDTANSRNSTIASTQPGIRPASTNQHIAAITSTLSASGSINLPKSVI